MPPRYRVLVLAAAWSGLRQGELLTLTRADLDLAAIPPVVRVLHRATAAAGVPTIRFLDLRHCAQVLAAESAATLAELMARMGHSTPHAAQVCMHARAERDRALADALGAAISADGSLCLGS